MPKCPYDNHVRLEFKDKICSCKDPLVLVTHAFCNCFDRESVCLFLHSHGNRGVPIVLLHTKSPD